MRFTKRRATLSPHPVNASFPEMSLNRDSIGESGGVVTGWKNKVGTAVVPDFSANGSPVYLATGMDSKPCILFDGINDYLNSSGLSMPGMEASAFFRVQQISDPPSNNEGFFGCAKTGQDDFASNDGFTFGDESAGFDGYYSFGRLTTTTEQPYCRFVKSGSEPVIYECLLKGLGGAEVYIHDNLGFSSSPVCSDAITDVAGINNTDLVYLGAHIVSGAPLLYSNIRISDVIIYPYTLSLTARQSVVRFILNQAGK